MPGIDVNSSRLPRGSVVINDRADLSVDLIDLAIKERQCCLDRGAHVARARCAKSVDS